MNVRAATVDDVEELCRLGNTVDEFKVSAEVVTFWPKETVVSIVIKSEVPIYVAEDSEKIIGFIITNYNPVFGKAIIENVFVLPGQRGKNVGHELLAAVLTKLRKLACPYVCALMEVSYPDAIKFYGDEGFSRGIDCVWMDLVMSELFKN